MSPADLPPLELEEIRELEAEFLEDLMSEPPGGHNHGFGRGPNGAWESLSQVDQRYAPRRRGGISGRKHGTRYVAQKIGCGCPVCRKWRRDHIRRHRERTKP